MKRCFLLHILALPVVAQPVFRHNLTVGAGAGVPLFERSRVTWEDSPLISAGYGYRFHRNLQADVMFSTTLSPGAKIFAVVPGQEGGGRIDSYLFGGRTIAPLRGGRLLLSFGLGAVHERFSAPPLALRVSLDETGWGGYALAGAGVALDQRGRFRLSITPRAQLVNALLPLLHRNRWLMLPVEFGVSF